MNAFRGHEYARCLLALVVADMFADTQTRAWFWRIVSALRAHCFAFQRGNGPQMRQSSPVGKVLATNIFFTRSSR
jgi:hypothetical protein